MIESRVEKVYYAKTKGRRYLTRSGAVHAETIAIISKKYPYEKYEPETGYYFNPREMPGFEKMYRRMKRLVLKNIN